MSDNAAEQQSRQQIIVFHKMLAKLEMEIHSRGELSLAEVLGLLQAFYDSFYNRTLYSNDASARNHFADELFTRMATLLSLWASCEEHTLSVEDLSDLSRYKEVIASIFYTSGYRGYTHLKTYLTESAEAGSFVIPQHKLLLYFVFVHIDDLDPAYLNLAIQLPEAYFTILMMGWLNTGVVLTTQGEKNRELLFGKSTLLSRVNPNQSFMNSVVNAWMYCSYSPSSNKREIKKNINKMICNFMHSNGLIGPKKIIPAKRTKPRILVIHERAGRNHAMFRCYLPIFSSLQQHFEVYSMAEQKLLDEVSKAVFPQHVLVSDVTDLKAIAQCISEINPDVIYYPSLGMSHWTIYMANLRLAPMQVMSCGHPESSFSDHIDFIYYGPQLPGASALASENILQNKDYRYTAVEHSELASHKLSAGKFSDRCKHVAINCASMKLSSAFIQLLKDVKAELGSRVKFHFFPAGDGLFNDGLKSMLLRQFPDATVYAQMPYPEFLQTLGQCHISLAPFPFGNTNSTVDSMLLGLPVVALKGYEFCSYTDYLVLQSFGLDQHFMCDSTDTYLNNVIALVNDEDYYAAQAQRIKSADIKAMLYIEKNQTSEFGEFIAAVYKKLTMYKSVKHKLITWDNGRIL